MHLTTCTNFSLGTVVRLENKNKNKKRCRDGMPKNYTKKEGRYSFRDSFSYLVFMVHDQMESAEILYHRPTPEVQGL